MPPPLITRHSTEHRARDERADQRFGHDNAHEQKCAAEAKINQAGNEAAPVIRELFPKELEGNNNEPVEQRRFLQARDAVVRWQEPLMGFNHLSGGSRILPFCLTVQISAAYRRYVQQRS